MLPEPVEAVEGGAQLAEGAKPHHPMSRLLGLFANQPESAESAIEGDLETLDVPQEVEIRVH